MLDVQSRAYRQQYGCNYITVVPNNLFGEHDNFDLNNSHVLPAIIRKIHEAKISGTNVVLWGDGSPLREFTYSKDLARELLFVLKNYDDDCPINIGNSHEISIKECANNIAQVMGYDGKIMWNTNMPAGQYRKPSDKTKVRSLGWKQTEYTPFKESISKTCIWFTENYPNVRGI
jgi:GDP-L-fucose synthase